MQYIVLDMEWNQPWPGSPSAKKVLPSPIRGEIVQIGAVRMPRDGEVADEFQTLIRPAYYKKMNRKVASLTGIKDSVLKERGKPFREAWSELTRVSAAQRLSGTCTGCQNRRICHSCAAMAMAETGSVSGIPKYLCEMVWAMRTEAARLLAERQKPTT